MVLNQAERIEKQKILQNTSLNWNGKDIFELKDNPNYRERFIELKNQLSEMGYELDDFFSGDDNGIMFCYKTALWNIYIKTKLSKSSNLLSLFKIIDEFFDIKGYSGSNEWKRDLCNRIKVPMVDALAFLDPKDGSYWFINDLKK